MLDGGGFRMIGRNLGPWVIDAEIGRGAMGTVYRAHRAEHPADVVALKVLNADLARDDVFVARFQREIEALRQLDHPNIVHFLEAGSAGGLFFYAMEFVDGRDCEAILHERGRLPWPEVLDLALQVVPALKHAHDHGIIHRDLKPANILIAAGSKQQAAGSEDKSWSLLPAADCLLPAVKLTDFGVAKLFARPPLTAAGSFVGTAAYLAPEQAVGKPATKRSDFYSLGGVLYTLITGRPPFPGENVAELIHKHCYAIPDRPQMLVPDLPHDLDTLVMQLLEKDPSRRPPDGFVLLKQLERIKGKLDRKQADGPETPTAHGEFVTLRPKGTVAPGQSDGPYPFGAGPATIASRLMRTTLEEMNKGGPIQRFFNHPLALVLMFAACVGLIAWGLTRKRASAEELYASAEPLMHTDRPADWRRAWDEYLEPLTSRYPDSPHRNEIAAFQQKMQDVDRLDKALKQADADSPQSDAQRFYQQGLTYLQNGDSAAARRVWWNLVDVFAYVPADRRWVELAQRGMAKLGTPSGDDRFAAAKEALAQARKLRDAGNRDGAARIWDGLEALYRGNPAATGLMDELQRDRGK
jgi:hypothetical protein